MQSQTSKRKRISSVSHTSQTNSPTSASQDHHDASNDHDQARKRESRQELRKTLPIFSDPIDYSSSDTMSFDEDDMYGSDSGNETISLAPHSAQANMRSEHVVCSLDYYMFTPCHISARMMIPMLDSEG